MRSCHVVFSSRLRSDSGSATANPCRTRVHSSWAKQPVWSAQADRAAPQQAASMQEPWLALQAACLAHGQDAVHDGTPELVLPLLQGEQRLHLLLRGALLLPPVDWVSACARAQQGHIASTSQLLQSWCRHKPAGRHLEASRCRGRLLTKHHWSADTPLAQYSCAAWRSVSSQPGTGIAAVVRLHCKEQYLEAQDLLHGLRDEGVRLVGVAHKGHGHVPFDLARLAWRGCWEGWPHRDRVHLAGELRSGRYRNKLSEQRRGRRVEATPVA